LLARHPRRARRLRRRLRRRRFRRRLRDVEVQPAASADVEAVPDQRNLLRSPEKIREAREI